MFRRLIVWLEAHTAEAQWRAELVRIFPTREAFEKAAAAGLDKQSSAIASATCTAYREGYRDGWAQGHVEGFDHCTRVVRQVFRDDRELESIASRLVC